MFTNIRYGSWAGTILVLLLAACQSPGYQSNSGYSQPAYSQPVYSGYGVVQSIEVVQQQANGETPIGVGAVAGGVVGGLVGSQVGSGSGKTAATIGGAAAGAYVGHQIEKSQKAKANAYRFTIRMDNGSYQTLMQSSTANLKVGDRVRIKNGVLTRP